MPSTFEQKLTDVSNDVKTYRAQYTKLKPDVKSRANNYDNALSMIYEAQNTITGLKEKIKKNAPGAVDEMKKWQKNYPAIFARMKPAADEVDKLKQALAKLKKDAAEAQKTAEQLNKDAARAAMGDVKKAAETLKVLIPDVKALIDSVGKQERVLNELPKQPNGVFV